MPDGTAAPKGAKPKQVRRCKYCGSQGHNRRTCEVLKRNIATAIQENKEFRAQLLEEMREIGLGVGSLVKAGWSQQVRMVTGIQWHDMNYRSVRNNNCSPVICADIGNPTRREYEYLPVMGSETDQSWGRERNVVVSPVSGSAVDNTMPADWLNGRSGVREMFADKDTKSACYWDNYYDR